MTTVTLTFPTTGQSFPAGTTNTSYTFTLTGPTPTQTKQNSSPTVWFSDLQPGGAYSCTCEKNGVVATQTFSAPAPPVTLQVPQAPASVVMS